MLALVFVRANSDSSVIIYVEFGTAFPFNGGELIYVRDPFFVTLSSSLLTRLS